jgi:hypothetical protein
LPRRINSELGPQPIQHDGAALLGGLGDGDQARYRRLGLGPYRIGG